VASTVRMLAARSDPPSGVAGVADLSSLMGSHLAAAVRRESNVTACTLPINSSRYFKFFC
jgi:hypothetical protein